ncbi:MAG: bifunctional oligoribonuclease/PAP phosphatase NrnA [Candidatus Dadabacteria bacterium]|nr:bifunctional oligoribonuclease/PAP phosphatase NrnA [Candidatus Dadabacteria bacterium]NIQ16368.1 bifunctional oligoribonuclease/PAP phosphatase NrnA [Candidatus Dadabacteria bacterium]
MKNIENIKKLIAENEKFLIVSHENPDCDAIGSMIALGVALERLGKHVELYNKDSVPDYLKFLSGSSSITNSLDTIDEDISVVILLDCAEISRPGKVFEEFIKNNGYKLAFIDHHKTNGIDSDYIIIDEYVSSTGILIYKLIKELGIEINKDIAESIFSTILGDTGSFRYSNTYAETFEIASELVKKGADPGKISTYIFDEEPIEKIKLMGLILNTLEVDDSGRVAFLHVDKDMYECTHTKKEHTEGVINYARSIMGVEVAALFKQNHCNGNVEWKISLRSKDYVDVSKIAQEFGGGGHHKASGCKIKGSLEYAKSTLYSSIIKSI